MLSSYAAAAPRARHSDLTVSGWYSTPRDRLESLLKRLAYGVEQEYPGIHETSVFSTPDVSLLGLDVAQHGDAMVSCLSFLGGVTVEKNHGSASGGSEPNAAGPG